MFQHVSVTDSFLWPNIIPLNGYTTFCLSTHSLVDGHLGCFHTLAIMNNAALNICIQIYMYILCVQMFSFLLGMYLEVRLLDMVTLCLPL